MTRRARKREFSRSLISEFFNAFGAQRTAGVDVKHPLRIATSDASIGRITDDAPDGSQCPVST